MQRMSGWKGFFALSLALASAVFAGTQKTAAQLEAEQKAADRIRMRMAKNRIDYREILLVDSVGWIKTLANRRPETPVAQLQQERIARKAAVLASFCQEPRFETLAEVDSISSMNAQDRSVCKSKAVNLIPLSP